MGLHERIGKSEGFTLVELMLVVIIIGILVAMVVPRLAGRSEQARIAAAQADIDANLGVSLDLYELDVGAYPESLEDLISNNNNDPKWRGPYIKKKKVIPRDPWGSPYSYKSLNSGTDYELKSFGRDRSEGGGDDISSLDEESP